MPIMTFFRLRLVAISLFVSYCIHVSSSGGREFHSLYPMPVNLAQNWGTVWSFNNRNIETKIMCSLLTCRFFRKLNRNITFFVTTLLCSITLILSLSSALLNSFHTKIKTIYWSVRIGFLILIIIMFIQFMGTCFSN